MIETNHNHLVKIWNEKCKNPRDGFIELTEFQYAVNFLEKTGWFNRRRRK